VLRAIEDAAAPVAARLQLVQTLREQAEATSAALDLFFLNRMAELLKGLHAARMNLGELKELTERLTSPPLIPARFLGAVAGERPLAMVAVGNSRVILNIAPDVDLAGFKIGDEVMLNQKQSAVLSKSPFKMPAHGQTAVFQRKLEDGRAVVRAGDAESIVGLAAGTNTDLKMGDSVRWDPTAQLVLEEIPQDNNSEFRLSAVPDLALEMVGGQRRNLNQLISALTMVFTAPQTAARYNLGGVMRAILLHGPPGTGKTLMVKVAAAHLQRLLGKRCNILCVRPGQFLNEYVGVTERKIREAFRAMRETEGFNLMFLDEIETIGRTRGEKFGSGHSDRFLGSLLVELQGMDNGGAESCAVIAATNRLDMLDSALVSRMELQLAVGRPDQQAAREIFSIHLGNQIPYHTNGHSAHATRGKIIDRAVGLFYGNGSSPLCTVKFRDGTHRTIAAHELASGRLFEQVCRAACETAAYREIERGSTGLLVEDIEEAVLDTQEKLAASLTRHNIHQYVSDLKQDLEVMAVEPVVRHVARPHRYVTFE
jgi:proteasome-associated ATPase